MKKLAFLALVAAAGCSTAGESASVSAPASVPVVGEATTSQLEAFKVLEASTNRSWKWVQHDQLKTPMHLSTSRDGTALLRNRADAVKVTLDLLAEHKALFRMRAPRGELSVSHTETDELGMTHARFQQMVHGVPVTGGELMAHYDKVGHLTSIDANYVADLDGIDVNPTFESADALAIVKAEIVSRSSIAESALKTRGEKLVVYASNEHINDPRLAYEYEISAIAAHEPAIWIVTVDAKTGDILHRYNNFQTIQASGSGVLGDQKTFQVTSGSDGFVMTSPGTVPLRTLTAEQQQEDIGADVTSSSSSSWDTGVTGQGAAVDAHFNAGVVLDYYKTVHARNAIDGKGGALVSTVHFGERYDNAAWTGTNMIYGDGGDFFRALSVSLDVVGHEFTHGVTAATSKLNYENQSGALNEAVSDIFGAFIEHSLKPDAVKNWQIGEIVTLAGGALRDMKDPAASNLSPQPGNLSQYVNTSQDNGGVHTNSGIINNAAYLMTASGVNPASKIAVTYGIGWEKSEKLWYRANTKYFMTTTNFGQAAQGVIQAAADVGLTVNETNIVDCAFKAVGVIQGQCSTLLDPTATVPAPTSAATPGADSPDDSSDDSPTPTKKRRILVTESSSGCNTTGSSADYGAVFGVALAVAGLAAKRRKRNS